LNQNINIVNVANQQAHGNRVAFVAEVSSLAHVVGQTVGRTSPAECDVALGDARCGINLENAVQKGAVDPSPPAIARGAGFSPTPRLPGTHPLCQSFAQLRSARHDP